MKFVCFKAADRKSDSPDVVRDTIEITELVVPDGGEYWYKALSEILIKIEIFVGWGWLVLFGAMVVNILIPGGALKSFGILFVEFIEHFHASPTEASWIPALCYFLYCGLGEFTELQKWEMCFDQDIDMILWDLICKIW